MFEKIIITWPETEFILKQLGVQQEKKNSISISVLCPWHGDENLGSAFCYKAEDNCYFHCFSCKKSATIISFVRKIRGCSFEEALFFCQKDSYFKKIDTGYKKRTIRASEAIRKPKDHLLYNKQPTKKAAINPELFYYTRTRGYTVPYISEVGIYESVFGRYEGFMITPIVDSQKGIRTFEARKLREYEYLEDFFERADLELEQLREMFKEYVEQKGHEHLLSIAPKVGSYLLKPKTLYASNFPGKETLFNIDNLTPYEDLYLVEGLAGIPKIWSTLSKNVTCTFGTSYTTAQLDLLKKFKKRIIVLPDFDKPGMAFLEDLNERLANVFCIVTELDNSELAYSETIAKIEPIEVSRYFLQRSGLLRR